MTIEEAVYSILSTDAGVIALCPAARIKPMGRWQNLGPTYIVHFPIDAQPIYTHQGLAAMTQWPFYQVSCFGASYRQARELSEAVIAALSGVHGQATFFWRGLRPVPDEEREVFQIEIDFEVAEAV